MKLRLFRIVPAALALIAALSACKKDDETREYMNGSVLVDTKMPSYVRPGDKYTFTPSGVTAPDGTAVGYYFSLPISGVKDTLRNGKTTYEYVVPDSLGTFSISCVAYPVESTDKYYSTTASMTFVIVSDDLEKGSIRNVPILDDDGKVVIDGRTYYTRNSGGGEWLLSNLGLIRRNSSGDEIFGHSFADCSAMQNVLGAYYTWEEAKTACPEGWHLPSDAEWVNLLKTVGAPESLQALQNSPAGAGSLMVKATFNGDTLWDYYRGVDIKNIAINAIPAGYANIEDGKYSFLGFGEYACFWTSDEYEGNGVFRYIYMQYDTVFVGTASKNSFAASVRCIR